MASVKILCVILTGLCVGVVDLIYRSLTLPFKNYNSICGVCVKFYFHCIVLVFLDVEKLFEN